MNADQDQTRTTTAPSTASPAAWPAAPTRRRRRRGFVVTVVVLAVLMALGAGWGGLGPALAWAGSTPHSTESATYPAVRVVEIGSDGAVDVTTGGAQVVVKRTARAALVAPQYSADAAADRLTVHFACPWYASGECRTALAVQVPEGTEVVVRTSDGRITARHLTGRFEAHSRDASTTVQDVTGDVVVHNADGAITISGVTGSVDAKANDADVRITDVGGSATVRTADGDSTVQEVHGAITARANDGDVTVRTLGAPVALTMDTADGDQVVKAPTDPAAATKVSIRTADGRASLLGPRG